MKWEALAYLSNVDCLERFFIHLEECGSKNIREELDVTIAEYRREDIFSFVWYISFFNHRWVEQRSEMRKKFEWNLIYSVKFPIAIVQNIRTY